jgi:hypothetical protein
LIIQQKTEDQMAAGQISFLRRCVFGSVPEELLTIARHSTPTSDVGVHAGFVREKASRPAGTADWFVSFNRPFGTYRWLAVPGVKTPGYFQPIPSGR